METFNATVKDKFSGLLFFLKRSKKEFEMVADEIEDNSLKTALNGLSDESSYYAGELKNYLKSLGIISPVADAHIETDMGYEGYPHPEDAGHGGELLCICSHNEDSLTKAYSELLNDSMPFQTLKEIMLYQLSALKYTFLKIKTLNTARFATYQ